MNGVDVPQLLTLAAPIVILLAGLWKMGSNFRAWFQGQLNANRDAVITALNVMKESQSVQDIQLHDHEVRLAWVEGHLGIPLRLRGSASPLEATRIDAAISQLESNDAAAKPA